MSGFGHSRATHCFIMYYEEIPYYMMASQIISGLFFGFFWLEEVTQIAMMVSVVSFQLWQVHSELRIQYLAPG